ncbi:PAS domain S-box protein [Microcoleus sp. FACHB-SPT15]|uniref:PAS domain S-box protein n=1 Tax=Microcoleus sp. FACHB-SPT15 TaxID=2692830 RepID=UPI001783EF75|nr:adenylate/guanylate cyclase domain-containing protein [Microcoleus sp. FACHB-SPT15]MBD1808295.1 PAS domain S-box protein [Microcoleus sp. FACHB-SPT15]
MTKQVVICVDDEMTVLRSLKAELKEAIGKDYLIEIAEGGEDALALLEELLEDGYEIPLIISDYIMPDMKGDELLKRVHLISPQTLKIMLTGQADLEAVGNAIKQAKLYRYIAKPWQASDLSLTVKEAVNSYLQDKKLAAQNVQLQQMNQELEQLTREQAGLIAQLHENESRLLKAQQKYRKIFENALEGIFQTTPEGRYISANHALANIYGYNSLEELMTILTNVQHQLYVEPHRHLEFIKLMQQHGEVSAFESQVYRRDGSIIWISENARAVCDISGRVLYYQGFVEDITERKQAEAERLKFTSELFELNRAFSRFVPRQFLQLLDKKSLVDIQLGDQVQQEMSVLFSDIRDFTTLSESMTPQENFNFINAYLSRMEPAIVENQGFIDKYIGDAIMALFSGIADDAVKAGITMLQHLAQYNRHRVQSGYIPIKIGIGINTGSLMLGTVGGQHRMDSTVISDTVNLASRLEGLTKYYGASLLISQQTLGRLHNPMQYSLRFIEQVKVKGKSKAVAVFEVFDGDEPDMKEGKLATKPLFEEGLFLYHQQTFKEAAQRFDEVLRINPRDTVAQIYRSRSTSQDSKIQRIPSSLTM